MEAPYYRLGEYDKAIQDYSRLSNSIRLTGWPTTIGGTRITAKGDYDRAIADFTRAAQIDPQDRDTYNKTIEAGPFCKNELDKAIEDFDRALQLDPNNRLAYCNRGTAKLKLGDANGSIKTSPEP